MEQESLIKIINDLNAVVTELTAAVQVRDELISQLEKDNRDLFLELTQKQINKYGEHDE